MSVDFIIELQRGILMIDEETRRLKIEECETFSADAFFINKPVWDLIIKPLKWSMEKTIPEIEEHIDKCRDKRNSGLSMLRKQWDLIILTLQWVIEDTFDDPLESKNRIFPMHSR